MSRGKKWAIWGITATGVFITLSIVTVNALVSGITNAADKDLPPAPGTTNSGELTPGQAGEAEQPAPEKRDSVDTDAYIFLADDGKTFQSYEQLVSSINVPVKKYPDRLSAQIRFYELMEKRANYDPTEKEVRNNVGIPEDQQLTAADYSEAAKLYRDAYNGLFENQSGELFSFMDQVGTFAYDVQTANYGAAGEAGLSAPKTKYEIKLEFPDTHDKIIIADNITETSIAGGKDVTNFITGTYDLTFTGFGPDQFTEDKEEVWKFGDRVVVTKKTAA